MKQKGLISFVWHTLRLISEVGKIEIKFGILGNTLILFLAERLKED